MNGFVLLNEQTFPEITKDVMVTHAGVLARQQEDLDQWYQGTKWDVVVADSEAAAPQGDGWILCKYVDKLDDPDALAYHTKTEQGRPLILLGVQIIKANSRASDWVNGPDSVLTAISHELPETRANPYVGLYVPLDGNTWVPQEICDPVQGDTFEYDKGSGLFISNFVGPRYWNQGGEGPYDRMGLVSTAMSIRPGGYQQRLVGGPNGSSSAVFGALPHEGGMAEWKRLAKTKAGSRFAAIAAQANGTDALSAAQQRVADLEAGLVANAKTIEDWAAGFQEKAKEAADLNAHVGRLRAALHAAQRSGGNGGHGG